MSSTATGSRGGRRTAGFAYRRGVRIVEVFGDVACPFTYAGLRRFVEALEHRAAPVVVRLRAWPLEWVNGRPLDPAHVAREIEGLRASVAPHLFTGFDPARFPTTSIPAFGLVAAAYDRNDATGLAVALAVRVALFEEGADVADPEVLRSIGAPHGVAPLDAAAAGARTAADWEEGRRRGVVGSPHYFVGDRGFFCPGLRIAQHDGRFDVAPDEQAADALLAEVLR